MVIPSILPWIKFRPISARYGRSGQFRPKFIFWPVWISELERHLLARSPKILLILSSVSYFCTCSSLSLYHLSLSDPLNRDREVDNKIEEQDEAKMVWLEKQKGRRRRWGEEKIAQKVKWWRKTSNKERSTILAGYSVVTSHVGGLGLGKNWKSVDRKLLGSSLVYHCPDCEFYLQKKP